MLTRVPRVPNESALECLTRVPRVPREIVAQREK